MKQASTHEILAIVTTRQEQVAGGAPIFYAQDQQEMDQIALYLARIFMAAIHDLANDTYILVKH